MRCAVYVSHEITAFGKQSLAELSSFAAERNAEVGITGYLYYDNGHFTQYIEGASEPIDTLLKALKRDSRHSILACYESKVGRRRFAGWHMKQLFKNHLIGIQMEHVLTDHLLFVSRLSRSSTQDSQPLWRMVDTIARFEDRISSGIAR